MGGNASRSSSETKMRRNGREGIITEVNADGTARFAGRRRPQRAATVIEEESGENI
jgi:hypothetical protein